MPAPTNGSAAGFSVPRRNRFFYGLPMGVDQFNKDMDYFNGKRWLLNRLVTGTGVVCGLEVTQDQADGSIHIQPGVALDAWGREIIVPVEVSVDPHQLTDDQGAPRGALLTTGTVLLCLIYAETCADPVPVLVAECDTRGNCAASTIQEGFRLIVREADAQPSRAPTCGFSDLLNGSTSGASGADALHALLAERIAEKCSVPAAGACVPLASVDLDSGTVDATGVRSLVYSNALLYELILCLAEQLTGTSAPQRLRKKRNQPAAIRRHRDRARGRRRPSGGG